MPAQRAGGEAEVLASIRHALARFNAGELETIFEETFDRDVDYSGDPEISPLVGSPADLKGVDAVRSVWTGFFEMFDEIRLTEIELVATGRGQVVGSAHMVASGGSSGIPIDAPFHFAWVLRGGRWVFMAAKLDRQAAQTALEDFLAGRRG